MINLKKIQTEVGHVRTLNTTLVIASLVILLTATGCEDQQKKVSKIKTKEDAAKAIAKLNESSHNTVIQKNSIVKCINIIPKLVTSDINAITSYTPIWSDAKAMQIMLYPQKTIQSNDKMENKHMTEAKPLKANVKAVYNDKDLAVMITWSDPDKTIGAKGLSSFADGIAMQFPVDYSHPDKLPYIGMGSPGRPVVIHLQKEGVVRAEPNGYNDVQAQQSDNALNLYNKELKAYQKQVSKKVTTDYEKMFIAEGFRSLSEIKDGTATGHFMMHYQSGQWTALLVRPLKDKYLDLHAESFPIAFAIWNGKRANRGSSKFLSAWVTVGSANSEFAKEVSHVPTGDITAGKQKVVENCAGCHNFDDKNNGMPFMAPDMSSLGGQASASYIKESIIDPSAVIVPGYNRNAHPSFPWYDVVKGKRVSTMPSFEWMSQQDINDIVAYLKTLR